ncbi:MAG: hypothetical protein U9R42_13530, partial [Bacteroidota bacterium]|nr:hypothetical protein [Bacteroidota bacterium]
YTPNHAKASCMWDKPRELTSYQGNGYEIACSSDDPSKNTILTANIALQSWKSSSGHKAVIINQGSWKKVEWKAIGIGLYKGYGVVWFGHEVDDSENK